ncbi:MAG: bifunctional (p)ppGpp synthetase/guanosine-3',5'-bis(diphosphate) 3'-pyrophosphohydrolase [Lachnospiraceae bacterium]|nr:bifunctional (p)ppGpp synthetase/guanosine-3',5'-bis(diphosphate) 3'-pyrophosphohydrolase [Lachnospiraceae bacterium]
MSDVDRAGVKIIPGSHTVSVESRSPEKLYQDLIARVRKYHPSDDISLIEKGYKTAVRCHEGQVRKSGEPYIIHPLSVAIILADLELDKETIVAGLLHDVIEDTDMTMGELKAEFGEDVANLVDGVTKLDKLQFVGSNHQVDRLEMQAENLRKMFLAMAKDIRVILIKLADRLHNMRTLEFQPPEAQERISRETLDIYSPIAQRLGISKIKVELDDLSLMYIEPEAYMELVNSIDINKEEREKYIQGIVDEVREHIVSAGIHAQVNGRIKHFFSIYKKMRNQNKTLDQIYDVFAVRIIVDSIQDCYAALGVIHAMYKPIPGRFKDYIAMPKANMYQSLHTTLIGNSGQPFEVQIRTNEMHKAAEYGIAAHWKYKVASDGKRIDDSEQEKLTWLRQILEWQQDSQDNREFMGMLKSDLNLFSDHVYCFTPGGEVKNLPSGSTPIDFAYSVHSAVGNRMIGARVNGKIVPIEYELKNGDRVEIITSQNAKGPSRDWLAIAKSSQARNKINQWFKQELKEDNIVKGRDALNNYIKTHSIVVSDIMTTGYMNRVISRYGFNDWDSLLAAIGHGALKEGQVIAKLQEYYNEDHRENPTEEDILEQVAQSAQHAAMRSRNNGSAITVKGIHDVAVRFSKCCSPVPGDEIVGFVTRGRGVSIHRTDCVNIINLPLSEQVRLIDAEWQISPESAAGDSYLTEISVYANNRSGLLADISRALTEKGIDILSVNCRTSKQGMATLNISFEIRSREELDRLFEKIKNVDSVIDIERTTG